MNHTIVYNETQITSKQNGNNPQWDDACHCLDTDTRNVVIQNPSWTVRYLTPIECERLQGFPDDWTLVDGTTDRKRYKAIGNSMAVPVMEWIGARILEVDAWED